MKIKKVLIKTVLTSFFVLNLNSAISGIPVVDGANLAKNTLNVMESINQTLKQIEEYTTQLQQYENQLKNSVGPAFEIWDKATVTMNNINNAMEKLERYKNQIGDLDAYLNKFQNVSYYNTAPCLGNGKCSSEDLARLNESNSFIVGAVKVSNDAALSTIQTQQKSLLQEAKQLEKLQTAVQGADGQMAALQYSNQLASNQSNQLLQMRALIIAQNNAITTKQSADNDKNAKESAAAQQLRSGQNIKSTSTKGMLQ